MAKFIDFDIEKIREENNGIKTDLGLIQDIINRIDDRMRFICRVDTFGSNEQFYGYFRNIKSEYEVCNSTNNYYYTCHRWPKG